MSNEPIQRVRVMVDTSVLVALASSRDTQHLKAINLLQMIEAVNKYDLIYSDCVLIETLTVIARRAEEQKRTGDFEMLANQVLVQASTPDSLVWLLPNVREKFNECVHLMLQTSGRLNFNDALIAIACKAYEIEHILSFDSDFDQITWLTRIGG
ncbi:MAG: type II toxin-antitoxin system VapC family toxin [Chloroflexi bacterium]|nr:type II toxin-antitoxin system VapC family toxin [Chloroflexota bacterium]